jgi:RNA polymerase primary sigma factor
MNINETKDLVQREILNIWWKNKCRGTIEAATGFGKSRLGVLACSYFVKKFDHSFKILIIVPTEALKREWRSEFIKWKETKVFNTCIDVQCINTAREYKGNKYDLVIFDEIHNYIKGKVNIKFFSNNKYDRILGLSATIEDNLVEHLDLIAPICYTLDLYQAVELGLVSEFTMYNIPVKLNATERKLYDTLSSKIAHTWENYHRQAWGSITARAKILYSAKAKMVTMKKIVKLFGEDEYGVIFNMTKDQADEVHKNLKGVCVPHHSGVSKKKRVENLKSFADGRTNIRILSSARTLDEGVNLPRVKYGLLMSSSSKVTQQNQRVGRVIRLGDEDKHAVVMRLYCEHTKEDDWLDSSQSKLNVINVKDLKELKLLINK